MRLASALALAAVMFGGAIFGFFYAWVCSTMWGLDAADPRVAIAAMQAMNASVRNVVFAPAFFGTPLVMAAAGAAALMAGRGRAGIWFFAGAATYVVFGLLLTMTINVPMNEALAAVAVPQDLEAARAVWLDYSPRWQAWNQVRTFASGIALVFAGLGALALRPSA
jgi:uncharacterized membrane protein